MKTDSDTKKERREVFIQVALALLPKVRMGIVEAVAETIIESANEFANKKMSGEK